MNILRSLPLVRHTLRNCSIKYPQVPLLMRSPVYRFSENPKKDKPDEKQQPQKQPEQQNQKPEQQAQKSAQKQEDPKSNFNANKNDQNKSNEPDPDKQSPWSKKFDQLSKKVYLTGKQTIRKRHTVSTLVMLGLFGFFLYAGYDNKTEMSPTEFMNMLETNAFKEITFVEEDYFLTSKTKVRKVEGTINSQTFFTYVLSFDAILKVVVNNPEIKSKNILRRGFDAYFNKVYTFMDIISIMVIIMILKGSLKRAESELGKRFSGGGNKNKRFAITKNTNIKFKDVAGMDECKREVQEIVDFLVNPTKYHLLGATIPKGVLLTGPPGTGKTMLAKACAGEAGVPFFSVSGSDFVEVFVGVGASRVRELFHEAKMAAPSIIFIDELDAIGKKRMNKLGSNDERESTLNQLLVEMDGFGTANSVIVMGATNRKQILDHALVRAGRFDREVEVNLPDLKGRFQIFLVHLTPVVLSPKYTKSEYAKRLASLTPGFSGAEIANLCNEAAILAARHNKGIVEMLDFELSSERVIGGVERKGFVSMNERKTVAYHESGHAVVSWFLQGADPLLKVTIIPRSKGALGFAQYFVNENQLQTKEELIDRICFILGGRCAELFFFKEVTTGAYDDLSKAYDLAYQIVAKFGMTEKIGYVAFPDNRYVKAFSEKVEAQIDREIYRIIQECTLITKGMVKKHEQDIRNLAEELLKKETLDARSIQKILGSRPFPPNKTFEAYLQITDSQAKQVQ